MRFKQIPSNEAGNEAYICEFEGAANIENDLVTALGSQLDVILDQEIKWVIMVSGARMPLDAKPIMMIKVKENIGELIDVYTPHWATCTKAKDFKKQ